jgi:NAD(P)-dependent dehydrogenase (short-subunit alcohol dehydrogenase family)
MLLTQAALPTLRAQRAGSIVNISSLSAQQGGGIFGGAHYCAAKAGVLGYTRALARELGPEGIRANAIAPGLIITDFSRSGRSDEEKDASAQSWPLQRAGRPVELASASLFLASDLSSFVTGATLDVNGGAYLR